VDSTLINIQDGYISAEADQTARRNQQRQSEWRQLKQAEASYTEPLPAQDSTQKMMVSRVQAAACIQH
jgi:hypothetical protein